METVVRAVGKSDYYNIVIVFYNIFMTAESRTLCRSTCISRILKTVDIMRLSCVYCFLLFVVIVGEILSDTNPIVACYIRTNNILSTNNMLHSNFTKKVSDFHEISWQPLSELGYIIILFLIFIYFTIIYTIYKNFAQ